MCNLCNIIDSDQDIIDIDDKYNTIGKSVFLKHVRVHLTCSQPLSKNKLTGLYKPYTKTLLKIVNHTIK